MIYLNSKNFDWIVFCCCWCPHLNLDDKQKEEKKKAYQLRSTRMIEFLYSKKWDSYSFKFIAFLATKAAATKKMANFWLKLLCICIFVVINFSSTNSRNGSYYDDDYDIGNLTDESSKNLSVLSTFLNAQKRKRASGGFLSPI